MIILDILLIIFNTFVYIKPHCSAWQPCQFMYLFDKCMHLRSIDLILIQSCCSHRMSLRTEGVQCGGVAVEFDHDNDRDSPEIKARNIPRMFLYLN